MSTSQINPIVTCSPWQPTRVKKAERNALRCGAAPDRDHAAEFAELESEKRRAEQKRDRSANIGANNSAAS